MSAKTIIKTPQVQWAIVAVDFALLVSNAALMAGPADLKHRIAALLVLLISSIGLGVSVPSAVKALKAD